MKKKYSLFIGRYSPPHKGHFALFKKVLDEGKDVCIAIRDTDISESDPYSFAERIDMIYQELKQYMIEGRVKVISIPDIEEICYGRKVGWGIKEIRLDGKTEKISATEIRKQNDKTK